MKLPDVRVHVECGTRHGHGPKPADPDLACDASENVKGSVESWRLSLFLSPANTYEHHPRTRTLCRVPRRRDLVAFHGPASHVHPLCRHVRFCHSKRFQRVVGEKLGPRHAEVVSVNLRFSPACRCLGPSNDRWMQNRQERRNPVSRREPGADARPLGPRPRSRLGLAGGWLCVQSDTGDCPSSSSIWPSPSRLSGPDPSPRPPHQATGPSHFRRHFFGMGSIRLFANCGF